MGRASFRGLGPRIVVTPGAARGQAGVEPFIACLLTAAVVSAAHVAKTVQPLRGVDAGEGFVPLEGRTVEGAGRLQLSLGFRGQQAGRRVHPGSEQSAGKERDGYHRNSKRDAQWAQERPPAGR